MSTMHGCTEKEMHKAFDAIAPEDWKAPITIELTTDEMDAIGGWHTIREAIIHYTATTPVINMRPNFTNHITADGYRAGPAGDH